MLVLNREYVEILIGALLLIVSFLISLFMVIRILEPSFSLSFFAFSVSLVGLLIGFHGIYGLVLKYKKKS
jgi:Co/Zn/Cd efflux system component